MNGCSVVRVVMGLGGSPPFGPLNTAEDHCDKLLSSKCLQRKKERECNAEKGLRSRWRDGCRSECCAPDTIIEEIGDYTSLID
jgi:hypothetical protein